jgi:uncharacterized membrane protein YgdD (TMEM256/DUF423 family)
VDKRWIVIGAGLASLAVAAGALGDHFIRPRVQNWYPADADSRIHNWDIAGRYLFFHALGICLVGLLPRQVPRRGAHAVAAMFMLGVALFSGCLFAYVLTNTKWLVHLVPFGGISFLLGWLLLAITVFKSEGSSDG